MGSKLLAYAQLLRLPNVFTAFADVLLAAAVAGYLDRPTLAWMLLGTGMLYLAGMVWNDVFDRAEDERSRPFRPIPSRRVPLRNAVILGSILILGGWACMSVGLTYGPFATAAPFLPGILAAAILLYDAWLKRTPFGPVAMGFCRFANIALCCAAGKVFIETPELGWHLAAVIGVYIVGVTWFARTEEGTSAKAHLRPAALVIAVAIVAAVMLPMHRPPDSSPVYFPFLLAAYGLYLARPLARAIGTPSSKNVQAAVKATILGLILFDAILASAFVGWPGLLIAILLLPARRIGQWVYST